MRISVWSSDVCSSDIAGVDRPWIGRLIVLLHLAEEDLLEICHFGLWNLSHRRFDVAVISLGVDFLHGLNLGDLLLSGRDRKSTRLNSSHSCASRMPSSA